MEALDKRCSPQDTVSAKEEEQADIAPNHPAVQPQAYLALTADSALLYVGY